MMFIGDYVSPEDTPKVFEQARLLDRVWTYDTTKPPPTLGRGSRPVATCLVLVEHQGGTLPWYTKGTASSRTRRTRSPRPASSPVLPTGARRRAALRTQPLHHATRGLPGSSPPRVNAYDFLMGRAKQCESSASSCRTSSP